MNQKEKLTKATMLALQGKLQESKYIITYYKNTAAVERRPQTKSDVEKDWTIVEEDYSQDVEAFENVFLEILNNNEEDLNNLYSNLDNLNNTEKINALKEYFKNQDYGDGSPIIISITGGKETYNSGLNKESFESEAEANEYNEEDDNDSENNDTNTEHKLTSDEIDFIEMCKKSGYDKSSIKDIKNGFIWGYYTPDKLKQFANPSKVIYSDMQLNAIITGLKSGVDVSKYADPKYNCFQMSAIRDGLEKGIDVSKYANPKYDEHQMWEIMRSLELKSQYN